MSNESTERSNFRRRQLLKSLGAAGLAGLAGCSSGGDNGSNPTTSAPEETETYEDTTTQTETSTPAPEVEHVPLGQWPQQYLLPASENSDTMIFDAWSPSQFQQEAGGIPYSQSAALTADNPAYSKVGFSAGEVPETFIQRKEDNHGLQEDNEYSSDVKIDQLPGGVSKSDVSQSLESNGYEKVNEIGGFEVYSNEAAETVHAVSEDRHAVALNFFEHNASTVTSQHREYLEEVLNQADQGQSLPQDLRELRDSMDLKDTFAAVNKEGYRLSTNGEEKMIGGVVQFKQPSFGGTSVDLEEGLKYGAWVLDDTAQAEDVYNTIIDKGVRNGWENISTDGRMLKAVGQIDMEGRLPQEYMAEELSATPKI